MSSLNGFYEEENKEKHFNSNENKALLWNLLSNNDVFKDIASKNYVDVKETFEETIKITEKNLISDESDTKNALTSKNKLFISLMISSLEPFKRKENYKAEDIKKERLDSFEKELEMRQKDLNTIMKTEKPKELDFSIELDNDTNIDIEKLLKEKEQERKNDLDNNHLLTHNDSIGNTLNNNQSIYQILSNMDIKLNQILLILNNHIIHNNAK